MPLDLLRQIAFDGELSDWIRNPPDLLTQPYPVTGLHLQLDSWFLGRVTDLISENRLHFQLDEQPPEAPEPVNRRRAMRRAFCRFAINSFGSASDRNLQMFIGWNERCREMNYPKDAKPVIVVIDYGPTAQPGWLSELPREYNGYPVRYRPSPTAEAQVGPGSRIGNGGPTFGTLGGFLQDTATHDLFGVTCAHVAGPPRTSIGEAEKSGKLLNIIGSVATSTLPAIGGPCNQHAKPKAGIDAALIRVDPSVLPTLSTSLSMCPIADIDQEDRIFFVGSKSQRVFARIAAATIWKVVEIVGQLHCFGDVFAMGHRQPGYMLQAVSEGGDSGAWVLDDTGSISTKWLGMVIAGDKYQNQSLGCYAEHTLSWSRSVYPNLVLPP
jgi:hypothetical protein